MLKKWLKKYKKKSKSNRFFLFLKKIKKNKKSIKKNLQGFGKEEKKEIKELLHGEESVKKYFSDSSSIFKDYFIPNDSNDNRPKILRPKQLTIIAVLLVLVKVLLVGYVFFVYQEKAIMSPHIANEVYILTNESRVQNEVAPLSLNAILTEAAKLKAEDMIANNYFSHTSVDGRRPWDFVDRSAYPYLLIGENLAMNFVAASDSHAALMASPSHKKNILNPEYTDIGIYVTSGEINGQDTNVLVEIFAYKKDEVEITPEITVANEDIVSNEEETANETEEDLDSFVLSDSGSEPDSSGDKVSDVNEASGVNETESNIAITDTDNLDVDNLDPQPEYEETIDAYEQEEVNRVEEATSTPDSFVDDRENTANDESDSSDAEIATSTETAADNAIINNSSSNLATSAVSVNVERDDETQSAIKLMEISKVIYVIFLLVLIIILAINIFVRVTVQHKSVIIQSLLLVLLILVLIEFDFDFMQQLRQASKDIILF